MVRVQLEIENLKGLREDLCVAQSGIGQGRTYGRFNNQAEVDGRIKRIQAILDQIDVMRPLGSDGRHGDRHTEFCGCAEQLDAYRNWRRIPAYPIYEMTVEGDVRVVDTHEIPEKFLVDPSDTNLACYLLTLWDGRTVVKSVLSLMNETFPELGGLKNG
jgi:hypothetical protein